MNYIYHAAGKDFTVERQRAGVLDELVLDKVVDCELDGLLGRDANQLNGEALVEAEDALVSDDLLEAVEAVSVHDLADVGARALILHARLDQVDRVDGERANRARNRAQEEPVAALHHLSADVALLQTRVRCRWRCLGHGSGQRDRFDHRVLLERTYLAYIRVVQRTAVIPKICNELNFCLANKVNRERAFSLFTCCFRPMSTKCPPGRA